MKPILFNTEMVIAILEDKKTLTRRLVKDARGNTPEHYGRKYFYKLDKNLNGREGPYAGFYEDSDIFYMEGKKCIDAIYFKQKYQVGDILWVRETFSFQGCETCQGCEICDTACLSRIPDCYKNEKGCFVYRTNYGSTEDDTFPPSMYKWKPSIHMPKDAARIFLKVTDVRVEKLQDITEEQAQEEGISEQEIIKAWNSIYKHKGGFVENISENLKRLFGTDNHFIYVFKNVFNSTVKKSDIDKYGWDANPWVWVYEFERCEKPEMVGL